MTVNDITEYPEIEPVVISDGSRLIDGVYTGDLLSWVMGRGMQDQAWVTIMTNINVIAVATLVDFSCVIIAEDAEIGNDVCEAAKAKGVNLLRSHKSSYELCSLLFEKIKSAEG